MKWTTELPTAAGYYWWRALGSIDAFIVGVDIERQTVSPRVPMTVRHWTRWTASGMGR